jgi:hypothetical protein
MAVWKASVILFYISHEPTGAIEVRETMQSMADCKLRVEWLKAHDGGTSKHDCFDIAKRYDTNRYYWTGPMFQYYHNPYTRR